MRTTKWSIFRKWLMDHEWSIDYKMIQFSKNDPRFKKSFISRKMIIGSKMICGSKNDLWINNWSTARKWSVIRGLPLIFDQWNFADKKKNVGKNFADKPVWRSWTLFRIIQCRATSTELISTIFWIFRFRFESDFVQFDFWVENFIKIGQNWNFVIFLKIRLNNVFRLFGPIWEYVTIKHV